MADAAPVTPQAPTAPATQAPPETPATGAVRGPDGKFTKAEAQAAAKAEAQLVKLLNGKELSLDEAIRLATKQVAGEDRFREASELRKSNEALDKQLKGVFAALKDPPRFAKDLEAIAKQHGFSTQDLAVELLKPLTQAALAAEEEKTLTDDQRAARKARQELEELKRQIAEGEKAKQEEATRAEQAKHEAETQKLMAEYDNVIVGVLKEKLGITLDANTPQATKDKALYTAYMITQLMQDMNARGVPVTVNTVAGEWGDFTRALSLGLQEGSTDTSLVSPNLLKAARKAEVEKLKAENPFLNTKPISKKKLQQTREAEKPPEDKRRSPDAVRRDIMMGKL